MTMHITILSLGSRGDVQPYIALGLGLRRAGHTVCIATDKLFEGMIRQCGLSFKPIAGDFKAFFQSKRGRTFTHAGQNPFQMMAGIRNQMKDITRQTVKDCWAACQDTDVVVASGFLPVVGHAITKKLNKPFIQAALNPFSPTSAFPSILFPLPVRDVALLNLASHYLGYWLFARAIKACLAGHLSDVFGYPASGQPILEMYRREFAVMCGWSPLVLAKPAGWHKDTHVTGYWFLEQKNWKPPVSLLNFLEAGPPPVYVGFGSMPNDNPAQMTADILAALKKSGQRGLLLTGWGGLSQTDLPDDVFAMEQAPHDWLFPRMAAVVHHGGAGTTAAALRAGVPSIIVPYCFDQPLWGDQINKLGVGPGPIPRSRLSVERLAAAIEHSVSNGTMQTQAAAVGERIRTENGVERAVELIERYLQ